MAQNIEDLVRRIKKKIEDINISVKDLRNPTAEFMMMYFINVLSNFAIDTNEITNSLEKPLLCIYPFAYLYRLLKNIYPYEPHLRNFTFLSLYEPTPEDVELIFRIDEFHDFCLNRFTEFVLPIITEIEENANVGEQLAYRKEELQTKLNNRAIEISEMAQEHQKLLEKVAQFSVTEFTTEDIQQLEKENALLQEQLLPKKTEISKVEKKLDICKTYHSMEENVQQLQEEVTQLEEMNKQLQERKTQKVQTKKRFESLLQLWTQCAKSVQNIEESTKAKSEVYEYYEKKYQHSEEQLSLYNSEIINYQKMKEKLVEVENEIKEKQAHNLEKNAALDKEVKNLNLQLKGFKKVCEDDNSYINQLKQKLPMLENNCEQYQQQILSIKEDWEKKYLHTIEQVKRFCKCQEDGVKQKLNDLRRGTDH